MISGTVLPAGGRPLLLSRLHDHLYHVILLPAGLAPRTQADFMRAQGRLNGFDTCLVGDDEAGIRCRRADGRDEPASAIPFPALDDWSSGVAAKRLRTGFAFPVTPELGARERALADAIHRYLIERARQLAAAGEAGPPPDWPDDPLRGGRQADPDEAPAPGDGPGGLPPGLLPCAVCGVVRGECRAPDAPNLVVPVRCACDNTRRCCWCRQPLHPFVTGAWRWDPDAKFPVYVPAWHALEHHCGR
jgi:hypothetical protein